MASGKQVLILLLSLLTLSSTIIKPSHAVDCPERIAGGQIAVYWGQNSDSQEGTLTDTCDSDLYGIVAIAFLHVSGDNRRLDLRDHCPSGDCKALESQIRYCQSKDIKIFLSVEIDSVDDPDSLAKYLYDNYLSGNSAGELGAVKLDGIDLAYPDYSSEPWEELVKAIKAQGSNIHISGAPHCSTTSLDSAIDTGLFDYLWVLFYGPWAKCEYLGDRKFDNVIESWKKWASKPGLANTKLFMGLVASPNPAIASYGYIPPDLLKSDVLPNVTQSSNFGGVMLWNRYYDEQTNYSSHIKEALVSKVCNCICQVPASKRFNSLLAKSV